MPDINEPQESGTGTISVIHDNKWFIIAVVWVLTLLVGTRGYYIYLNADPNTTEVSGWESLYLALQLFVLSGMHLTREAGLDLQIVRFIAPAVAAYTAVEALISLYSNQLRIAGLRFYKKHTIICGLGRIGWLLIKGYRDDGVRVVVIEVDENNAFIKQANALGTVVIIGNAVDPKTLNKARARFAERIVAGTGDDSLNVEIAWQAREIIKDVTDASLICYVHLVDHRLYELLHQHPVMTSRSIPTFEVRLFNINSCGARLMIEEYPPFKDSGEPDEHVKPPRVVVLGIGQFGRMVILETAIRWRLRHMKPPIDILVIDSKANAVVENLLFDYPILSIICRFEKLEIDFEGPDFPKAKFLYRNGKLDVSSIYVCLNDDRLGLVSALTLAAGLEGSDIPVIVRTSQERGLGKIIRGDSGSIYKHLKSFELMECAAKPDQLGYHNEHTARLFHKQYVNERTSEGKTAATHPALVDWENLSPSLRLSNWRQADGVYQTLGKAGYRVVPIDAKCEFPKESFEADNERIAEIEHDRFVSQRIRDRWRDGDKSDEKKTTPYLVPWEMLTEEIKGYDRTWAKNLPEMLAEAGYKICRKDGTAEPECRGEKRI